MGKSNGRIQDWVKGGSGLRVTNGAAHVRIMGGGGESVTFPITQAQGGTGRSSALTIGQIVFAGATTYEGDPLLIWNNTGKRLLVGGPTDDGSSRLQVAGAGAFTFANGASGIFRSGGVGSFGLISIGRASEEFVVAVVQSASAFITGTIAGDIVLETPSITQSIWFGTSAGAGATMILLPNDAGIRLPYTTATRVALLDANKNLISGPATAVTGSRASGAALTDLLTKLATIGVITDSTSA